MVCCAVMIGATKLLITSITLGNYSEVMEIDFKIISLRSGTFP